MVVAAVAVAAALTCRPETGLGTVSFRRGRLEHVLDLSTCRDRASPAPAARPKPLVSPDGRAVASIVSFRRGTRGTESIVVRDRRTRATKTIYRVRENYRGFPQGAPGPLMLVRWSGDSRWLFFALDPQGSASLIADGIMLEAVSVQGGRPRSIGFTLAYDDYLSWCGGRLVFSGGGDRIATNNKRLLVAWPPGWNVRPLVNAPKRAWGSVTCAPDGKSVVVQSQAESSEASFWHTRWALWRVGFDGSQTKLTSPPAGYADESPRFDGDALLFVRMRRGYGTLYGLRAGRLTGPFAALGFDLGYYGHHDWPYSISPS